MIKVDVYLSFNLESDIALRHLYARRGLEFANELEAEEFANRVEELVLEFEN